MPRVNEWGQPIGPSIAGWTPPPSPSRVTLQGRYASVVPLDAATHCRALFESFAADSDARRWTYLPYGPFDDLASFRRWLEGSEASRDPLFFTIVDARSGAAAGLASYLRIAAEIGCTEVGHLNFSARVARSPAATEAMYLMMKHAFELGYRRYEWKCDALNAPSRAAAERLGFVHEGVFRQATVYKGRSRDTAWYAIIDAEWPALRAAFQRWLDAANFDDSGAQRVSLSELTRAAAAR